MPEHLLIAIVDDDESIREAMKNLLESAGLEAAAFASANALLGSALLPGVSCVVADMRMGAMSGLALHERLVASDRSIPVILMTAYPDERVRARALDAGVVAYLAKPFAADQLLGSISAAVRPVLHGPEGA